MAAGDDRWDGGLRRGQGHPPNDAPNVVTIHDVGELGGRVFLATEFVEGHSLRERLRQGPISVAQVAGMALLVAAALEAAHAAGILHRDIKAFVVGAIDRIDSRYLLTLEAIEAESGDVIGRTQAEAEGRGQVLDSLRQAAAALRARLGETLTSIQRFDPPVDRVTTASLPALKSYALGREAAVRGRLLEAIPLLVRATEIDPGFAVAHAQLAAAYNNLGNDQLASESAARAYALHGAVSERESLYITQHYRRFVEGDLEGAIDTLNVWKHTFPRDHIPWNNLAALYLLIGRHEEALAEVRESLRLNPDNASAYTNLTSALIALGRGSDARDAIVAWWIDTRRTCSSTAWPGPWFWR